MKKVLGFAVALGLVIMVAGCSTLSPKDQQRLSEALALFQCIDGVIVSIDEEDPYTVENTLGLYQCVDGALVYISTEED